MGAGRWRDRYNEALRDREVVVLADNDDPGRRHLLLPDLPPKGDFSDWLDAGGSVGELGRLAAAALADPGPASATPGETAPTDAAASRRGAEGDVLEAARPHFAALAIEFGLRVVSESPNERGWLKCRAVDRDDARPSAGFNVETGVYHDFGAGGRLSFLALATRLKPEAFPDERVVLDHLAERFGAARPGEAWEPPLPFHDVDPPPFPTDALAGWQRDFIEAEATATQTPPDLAAMLVLSVTAAACAGKVVVGVNGGYEEPVNIFTVTAQPSASRKTAVFRDVAAPIEEHERDLDARSAPAIAEARNLKAIDERALEDLQRRAAKAKGPDRKSLVAQADELARRLAAAPPRPPRLLADDATAESLGSLLAENGGMMGVFSPEGGRSSTSWPAATPRTRTRRSTASSSRGTPATPSASTGKAGRRSTSPGPPSPSGWPSSRRSSGGWAGSQARGVAGSRPDSCSPCPAASSAAGSSPRPPSPKASSGRTARACWPSWVSRRTRTPRLTACLESRFPDLPAGHQVDHRQLHERFAAARRFLVALAEPARPTEPGEGAFHPPSEGDHHERLRPRLLRHHLQPDLVPRPQVAEPFGDPAVVDRVGDDQPQPAEAAPQRLQDQPRPVAVLNVGGMDLH
ncbi:DUF3987 domain-containing protein [Paludisphaera sp. Pla2]|uniref:DUF3987 domain-containing protein n=1 Tax=Paludisphaera mucosa TaxID=3030827 RepID=A0ABT6FAY5_9BACT|nr:DUF3987 domain-containing protein [Paludisphaera mucosa]MDG3004758.1 DUF3987 domain-containing protein [Paludisphaera mucosa]